FAEIKLNAADCHIDGGEAPGGGVAFLSVNTDLVFAGAALVAAVAFHKFLALDEESPAAHGGIVHAPFERLKHLDDEGNDGFGGVILPAFFPFGEGELAQEILENVAEDIFTVEADGCAFIFFG